MRYAVTYQGFQIDIYRVLYLFDVVHPCHQHAVKKLLRAGAGSKPLEQDIRETIETLERWLEMNHEV